MEVVGGGGSDCTKYQMLLINSELLAGASLLELSLHCPWKESTWRKIEASSQSEQTRGPSEWMLVNRMQCFYQRNAIQHRPSKESVWSTFRPIMFTKIFKSPQFSPHNWKIKYILHQWRRLVSLSFLPSSLPLSHLIVTSLSCLCTLKNYMMRDLLFFKDPLRWLLSLPLQSGNSYTLDVEILLKYSSPNSSMHFLCALLNHF